MPDVSTMTMIERHQRRLYRNLTPNQMIRGFSSLLVPLMIAIFTIVTTVSQMNLAKQQREQDLQIAKDNREKDERIEESRRERDFEIANQTRVLQNEIEEKRRAAEAKAHQDQQMNIVLAVYLKDMTELMLSRNFTLTDNLMATVVRAKTLTTFGQLDGKRKDHLVRFLFEARMIGAGRPSVDLKGADLSNMDLTNYKLNGVSFVKCNLFKTIFRGTSLQDVDFSNAQLNSASFDNSYLTNVTFYGANLTDASFVRGQLPKVDFSGAILTDADLTGIRALNLGAIDIKGNNTIFNEAYLTLAYFTDCTLMNASFIKTQLWMADMSHAILDRANFTDADLSDTNFDGSKLSESIFDRSSTAYASFYGTNLEATQWLDTNVRGADFSQANLSSASITSDQLRRAGKTFNITLPDGSLSSDTNLLRNGDAEGVNGECETSPWHVNSMVAQKYNLVLPEPEIYGKCHFTKQSNTTQATMSQRVSVSIGYGEWILTDVAFIRITGRCECDHGFTMHVRQFNGNNNLSLVNNTHNSSIHTTDPDILFPTHTAMTEIELEIVFTKSCSSWDNLGSCDNMKLTIWHRNYTI